MVAPNAPAINGRNGRTPPTCFLFRPIKFFFACVLPFMEASLRRMLRCFFNFRYVGFDKGHFPDKTTLAMRCKYVGDGSEFVLFCFLAMVVILLKLAFIYALPEKKLGRVQLEKKRFQ